MIDALLFWLARRGARARGAAVRRAALRPAAEPGARLRAAARAAPRRVPGLAAREPPRRPVRPQRPRSASLVARRGRARSSLATRLRARIGLDASRDTLALARRRGALHRRVLRLGAAAQLRAGRLADREADGHGARQRRQPERVVPAARPVAVRRGRQLLLLRPLPGRVPRPASRASTRPSASTSASRSSSRSSTVGVFGVAAALYEAARARAATRRARSPSLVGLDGGRVRHRCSATSPAASSSSQDPDRCGSYDWWAPSRVIDGTANEFPFFSFLLADLHAHVMATPFALVAVAYALQLGVARPAGVERDAAVASAAAELVLAALVLGSLYAINSFDFPTACAIGARRAARSGRSTRRGRWRRAASWGGAWLAASRSSSSCRSGCASRRRRRGIGVGARARQLQPLRARLRSASTASRCGSSLALFAGRLPRAARVPRLGAASRPAVRCSSCSRRPELAGLAARARRRRRRPRSSRSRAAGSASRTASSGCSPRSRSASLASGEFVYLRDAFDGTASYRFNTVFKAGYQAWFLLAIVAGVGVFWSARWLGPSAARRLARGARRCSSRSRSSTRSPASYSRLLALRAEPDARRDALARAHRAGRRRRDRVAARARSTARRRSSRQVGEDFDPEGRGRVSTFTGSRP